MEDNKLSDAEVNQLLSTLKEAEEQNKELKILRSPQTDIPSKGELASQDVIVDTVTGEKIPIAPRTRSEVDLKTSLCSLTGKLEKEAKSSLPSRTCIRSGLSRSTYIENLREDQKTNLFSDENIDKIIEIIDLYRKSNSYDNNKINYYRLLPEDISKIIYEYSAKYIAIELGYVNNINKICKDISIAFIEELNTNIELEEYNDSANKDLERLWINAANDISKTVSDLNTDKKKYLEDIINSDDPDISDSTKALVKELYETIEFAYNLKRLKARALTTKIKKIELEKPQSRVFNIIEDKYRHTEKYNIPALSSILAILNRHNKIEDPYGNLKFLCVLCKNSKTIDPNNILDHAYISTILQNIILLEVYQGEKYIEYSTPFLSNINEVISLVK